MKSQVLEYETAAISGMYSTVTNREHSFVF